VTSVALVGPDGAGKSTVSDALLVKLSPVRVKRIYMGVNLEASTLMLPTTRLIMRVKRSRGRRADMTAPTSAVVPSTAGRSRRVARALRMGLWIAEEWFRAGVAAYYEHQGYVVVFDRHFFADYYHYDVSSAESSRRRSVVHGFLLARLYPKPDLVICLDAPGDVLFRRKGEASPGWLEQRRQQYLQLADVVPRFSVVDADRPLELVVEDVARIVTDFRQEAS